MRTVEDDLSTNRLRCRLPPCKVKTASKSTTRLMLFRGPEIESWFGVDDGQDPATDNDWSYLPFMALSDGAHAYIERVPIR